MRPWLTTSRWPRLLGLSLLLAVAGAVVLFTTGHRYRVKKIFASAERSWEEGDYQRAVELYQAVIDEDPGDPLSVRAQFQVGSTYHLFLQRDREAVQAFRDLIKKNPAGPWSLRAQELLGEIFEKRFEDYRQAIVEYQRLINLSGGGEEGDRAQLAVARCYFKMGDFDQARGEYEIHLEWYPGSPRRDRALAGAANSHYVVRAFQSAIRYYRQVIEVSDDPKLRAEAGFGIASCLEEAGDLRGALAAFAKVRRDYPNPELVEQRLDRLRKRLEKQEK